MARSGSEQFRCVKGKSLELSGKMKLGGGQTVEMMQRENRANDGRLHPAWVAFIRYCQELGFGEVSQLKIQDGLPVMAEETTKKVKFI